MRSFPWVLPTSLLPGFMISCVRTRVIYSTSHPLANSALLPPSPLGLMPSPKSVSKSCWQVFPVNQLGQYYCDLLGGDHLEFWDSFFLSLNLTLPLL
jgi:hypothetical protein